jgi:predicted CXXCH cytochrome family protein
MKIKYLLVVCIFLQGCLISDQGIENAAPATGQYTKEQVHGKQQECNICHQSHRMKDVGLIKKPISELCLECHPDSKKSTDHVVDVFPSMDVSGFLLVEGKMTCVSCHDSHKNTFANMLRTEPGKLCVGCHDM